jgi:predicted metal-dependent HD superfamily phosphohydrolase
VQRTGLNLHYRPFFPCAYDAIGEIADFPRLPNQKSVRFADMKEFFIQTVAQFSTDEALQQKLWQELEQNYGHKNRHYHTLRHIKCVLEALEAHQKAIQDWESMVFAVFYHDAVYRVLKKNNEQKSAELAEKRLRSIRFPEPRIALCKKHILATKNHTTSPNPDTNLLIDADLSILGAEWETYLEYTRQVRWEYAVYPDLLYRPGRKKVLLHFLEMESIFKTAAFRQRLEEKARENILNEISLINTL